MRIFQTKIFDGIIRGTGNVYTQTADAELLGSVERLNIGAQMYGVTGTSPSLTIQIENSPDGTRWKNQSASAELVQGLSNGDNILRFFVNGQSTTIPIAPYVRLRITLSGTAPSGYLRLWAIGRNPAI